MDDSAPARPQPPGHAHARGRLGETLAALYLESRGYTIRARNLRLGRRELDLVAARGDLTVVVEVKWRRAGPRGAAVESWPPAQRRRAGEAALAILAALAERDRAAALRRDWRFDLVVIEEDARGWRLTHHPGAWSPAGSWW